MSGSIVLLSTWSWGSIMAFEVLASKAYGWQSLFARAILQARSIGSFVDNVVFFRIIEFLRQDLQSPWPKP